MEFRRIEEKDIPELIELGKYVHTVGEQKGTNFDEIALTKTLETLIDLEQTSLPMLVRNDEGEIVAYMLAVISSTFFGSNPTITNIAWYVREDSRKNGYGPMMINFLKNVAINMGIKEIRMEGPKEIVTFMEKKGFIQTSCNFLMRID